LAVPRCPRVTGDGDAELPNGGEARGDVGLEGTETNLGYDEVVGEAGGDAEVKP
jgi:hypothetical protein